MTLHYQEVHLKASHVYYSQFHDCKFFSLQLAKRWHLMIFFKNTSIALEKDLALTMAVKGNSIDQ